MQTSDFDKALIEAVKACIPPGINPVWFVMDVLSLGKEAAYRRLRGEVPLTLKEAALLARQLGFSLNQVVNNDTDRIHHYSIFLVDFEMPRQEDYKVLETYLEKLSQGVDDPFSQLSITTNIFPQQLYLRYKNMTKFAVFKWLYQSGQRQPKNYQEVKVEDRMLQVFRDSLEIHRRIRTIYYIFDKLLCHSLVDDLRYFYSVGLLSNEDREAVRSEAHKLLDYMEQLAIEGKHENGSQVQMYVSDIHFNKSYYNVKAGQYHVSVIEACVLNGLASTDMNCYLKMNDWIHSRRRLSTLISCSGEPQRIAFFRVLHRQLDEM